MDVDTKDYDKNFNFYSEKMFVTKRFLTEHHLKLTYQRNSITNLELKHKEWSKYFGK